MGVDPTFAIPLALEKCGLNLSDIDIFELNLRVRPLIVPINWALIERFEVASVCIGTGMGAAAVFEREDVSQL